MFSWCFWQAFKLTCGMFELYHVVFACFEIKQQWLINLGLHIFPIKSVCCQATSPNKQKKNHPKHFTDPNRPTPQKSNFKKKLFKGLNRIHSKTYKKKTKSLPRPPQIPSPLPAPPHHFLPGPGMGEGRPAAWRPFKVAPGAAPTSAIEKRVKQSSSAKFPEERMDLWLKFATWKKWTKNSGEFHDEFHPMGSNPWKKSQQKTNPSSPSWCLTAFHLKIMFFPRSVHLLASFWLYFQVKHVKLSVVIIPSLVGDP